MADVIRKATNKFTKGLVLDFSPENTQNEVLTHALNATLLTFNGNEFSLQNDMGNARVETAFLPEGYIPVGTCEYGGIIYIVSYNPLEDKSQIGCFPSPERNVSSDELGIENKILSKTYFQGTLSDGITPDGTIKNTTQYVLLKNDSLNPGDKFLVCSNKELYNENLSDLWVKDQNSENYNLVDNPILSLNIVSIEDSGKIVYLNSDLVDYNVQYGSNDYKYHILGDASQDDQTFNQASVDVDNYRNILSSGYNVFKSKTSGKLAILAELIMIDSYSVTHRVVPSKMVNEDGTETTIEGKFDVIISTEILPEITSDNYYLTPKLKYYNLNKSQGFIQTKVGSIPMFVSDETNKITYNPVFYNTTLTDVYVPVNISDDDLKITLQDSSEFNFFKAGTYHGRFEPIEFSANSDEIIYSRFERNLFYKMDKSQLLDASGSVDTDYYINEMKAKFYSSGDGKLFTIFPNVNTDLRDRELYIKFSEDTYIPSNKLTISSEFNHIYTNDTTETLFKITYPKCGQIHTYTVADFIPEHSKNTYPDIKLASIKLPDVVYKNGLDLPFKYDYTLVPCMNYGKLQHLAVSNTVDFSKLHAFNQSTFSTWKYRIDGDQLRLTFGADVFDTYETDKVDGLVLEFYDAWGFAGSLTIEDKKSYSGVFTKVIPLNTLQALSNKRITDKESVYKHNVDIKEGRDYEGNVIPDYFELNGSQVTWNVENGWSIPDEELNDCGTIYSNILYGVKAYLRRPSTSGKEYIKTNEFFLYTLPIFNEYYYNLDNFNNIFNPQLDLVLTYKLEDYSTKIPYTGDSGIRNGYCIKDSDTVNQYIGGSSKESFDVTKYYKYSGTTNLWLEIGLKQEYETFNVSYSPEINKYFSTDLELISNEGQANFDVDNSSIKNTTITNKLHYNHSDGTISESVNTLHINGNGSSTSLDTDISKYNFINGNPVESIPIDYDFVVGYPITVTNIRETQVPATTVCALCHQDTEGNYNYSDFGLYESDGELLSDVMFYNGGVWNVEEFGVCRMISTTGTTMLDQCRIVDSYSQHANNIQQQDLLNAGEPLRKMLEHVGKLTFCQPHAHGMSIDNGTNIYKYSDVLGMSPNENLGDSCLGIIATDVLYNNPHYSMSLNTQLSMQGAQFVSTLDYKTCSGKIYKLDKDDLVETDKEYTMRQFTGLTASEIASFNAKLIQTMKSVYAYNPDYDSINAYIGEVKVTREDIKFSSNLISKNAKLEFEDKTFNDFIYLGTTNFKSYLTYLSSYSDFSVTDDDGILLPQVSLTPGLTYCGGDGTNYLISSLTYNIPTPDDIESDLDYSDNGMIIVQNHDGTRSYIKGDLNKKLLYGLKDGILVQLDVTNYQIDDSGSLSLKQDVVETSKAVSLTITKEILHNATSHSAKDYLEFTQKVTFNGVEEDVNLKLHILPYGTYYLPSDASSLYMSKQGYFQVSIDSDDPRYKVTGINMHVKTYGKILNEALMLSWYVKPEADTVQKILSNQSGTVLSALTHNDETAVIALNRPNRDPMVTAVKTFWASPNPEEHLCQASYTDYGGNSYILYFQEFFESWVASKQILFDKYRSNTLEGIPLFEISIDEISFKVTKTSTLFSDSDSDIIYVNKTSPEYYLDKLTQRYSVLSKYADARLRGTSITLNDLEYNPTKDGHRLFMRNKCYSSAGAYRNIIYYRSITDKSSWTNNENYQHKNHLYIQTGPCFTSDNL